jgi:predicted metalloprotease
VAPPADDEGADFVSRILGDTEDTWTALFAQQGRRYDAPVLVLFSQAVQSACGTNSAAVGPFYCPADQRVYIDLSFYRELRERFGAPGDFAQAYVIAHEVGHHVQNLLGIADQVRALRGRADEAESNALSVRMELQADCLAGVWGHHMQKERHLMEAGDLEEGLGAAAAIGDDRMQRGAGRAVQPESWTHGSSDMRTRWLRRGLENGSIEMCDTFGTTRL